MKIFNYNKKKLFSRNFNLKINILSLSLTLNKFIKLTKSLHY